MHPVTGFHVCSVHSILLFVATGAPCSVYPYSIIVKCSSDALARNRVHAERRIKMKAIRVFDPACGSGNFLVIAYKQMCEIEAEINRLRGEPHLGSEMPLTNYRGIELRDLRKINTWIELMKNCVGLRTLLVPMIVAARPPIPRLVESALPPVGNASIFLRAGRSKHCSVKHWTDLTSEQRQY